MTIDGLTAWVLRQRNSEPSADAQFDLGYRCAVERVAGLLGMETQDPRDGEVQQLGPYHFRCTGCGATWGHNAKKPEAS